MGEIFTACLSRLGVGEEMGMPEAETFEMVERVEEAARGVMESERTSSRLSASRCGVTGRGMPGM